MQATGSAAATKKKVVVNRLNSQRVIQQLAAAISDGRSTKTAMDSFEKYVIEWSKSRAMTENIKPPLKTKQVKPKSRSGKVSQLETGVE